MSAIRTRFAPSPTGLLHLGHARAAFEAFEFAQRLGGICLLRIEDIDHTRCRPEFTTGIYRDLDALGLDWPLPVRVQSQHYGDYARVIANLMHRGLAYPCALTRREIKAGQMPAPSAEWREKWPVQTQLPADTRPTKRGQTQNLRDRSDYSLNAHKISDVGQGVEGVRAGERDKGSTRGQILCDPPVDQSEVSPGSDIIQMLESAENIDKPALPAAIRLNMTACLDIISDYSLLYEAVESLEPETQVEQEVWPEMAAQTEPQELTLPLATTKIDAMSALYRDFHPTDGAPARPDPIIARRDIGVSYHIAVTHDDALQEITHVVRGADLRDETPLHILIQRLMGWPQPIYYHHDLVLRADGEKLAKRNLDTGLRTLFAAGHTAADIREMSGIGA